VRSEPFSVAPVGQNKVQLSRLTAIRRTPLWPVTTEDHYPTHPQFAVDAYHWTRQ